MITALWQSFNEWVAQKHPVNREAERESCEFAAAAAAKAFREIDRVTKERLEQAVRIQQASASGADGRAERQKYLDALERWNADLSSALELLINPEGAELGPFCDDSCCEGCLTESALARRLQRLHRRRLKASVKLLTFWAFLSLPGLLLALG